MARPRTWLLNFDADDELGGGPDYAPSPAVLRRFPALTERVRGLLGPADRVLGVDVDELSPGAFLGQAWCPTPWALRTLGAAGAALPDAPAFSILREVNHRRFSASARPCPVSLLESYEASHHAG